MSSWPGVFQKHIFCSEFRWILPPKKTQVYDDKWSYGGSYVSRVMYNYIYIWLQEKKHVFPGHFLEGLILFHSFCLITGEGVHQTLMIFFRQFVAVNRDFERDFEQKNGGCGWTKDMFVFNDWRDWIELGKHIFCNEWVGFVQANYSSCKLKIIWILRWSKKWKRHDSIYL